MDTTLDPIPEMAVMDILLPKSSLTMRAASDSNVNTTTNLSKANGPGMSPPVMNRSDK
jgi:hypothetical protein